MMESKETLKLKVNVNPKHELKDTGVKLPLYFKSPREIIKVTNKYILSFSSMLNNTRHTIEKTSTGNLTYDRFVEIIGGADEISEVEFNKEYTEAINYLMNLNE